MNSTRSISFLLHFCFSAVLCLSLVSPSFALEDSYIASRQKEVAGKSLGDRIAFWAERFLGVPYDPDIDGAYVTRKAIVADDKVDCMYLTFRAAELALGNTPKQSIDIALDKRFRGHGILENGAVVNYNDRFRYGEDMIDSGKWGEEITDNIGPVSFIKGSRGRQQVKMVSKETLVKMFREKKRVSLKSGDIVFFVKAPEKRIIGEIIGHIGIIERKADDIYLIHASGRKNGDGEVKEILLSDYVKSMPFVGVRISRLP
jgi:hypothetical protein